MSASDLEAALGELRRAKGLADGEAAERLDTIVDRVSGALEAGRTVDHGALARMMRTLDELDEDTAGETAQAVRDAKAALRTYREGVPGA